MPTNEYDLHVVIETKMLMTIFEREYQLQGFKIFLPSVFHDERENQCGL